MDVRLTVQPPDSTPSYDVWVSTSIDTLASDVFAAVLPTHDAGSEVLVNGIACEPDDSVRDAGLRDGAILTVVAPDGTAGEGTQRPPSAWQLHGVQGPADGKMFALVPGYQEFGRSRGCALRIQDSEVSRRHFALEVSDLEVRIKDLGSMNGTYIDGQRQPGGWCPVPNGALLSAGANDFRLVGPSKDKAPLTADGSGGLVLNRRFRIRPPTDPASVEFPAPPDPSTRRPFPWVLAALPLAGAVGLAAFTRQPTFLLFALLSPLTMVASQWTERRQDKLRNADTTAGYERKHAAACRAVAAALEADRLRWRSSFPTPEEVVDLVQVPRARLWERRPGDDDFLCVRIGVGTRRSTVHVRAAEEAQVPETLVKDAPITLDLATSPVVGIAGPKTTTDSLIGWIAFQVAALHSPEDVRIVVLSQEASFTNWGFIRWLPHCVDQGSGTTLIGLDQSGLDNRIQELTTLVEDRAGRNHNVGEAESPMLPRILVVLDGASELRRRPSVAALLRKGPSVGCSFVCTDGDVRLLPEECTSVAVVGDHQSMTVEEGGAATPTDVMPDAFSSAAAETAARTLAPVRRVAGERMGELPLGVRLLDLISMPLPDPDQIWLNWRGRPAQTSVVVGAGLEGDYSLDIARDGPHILVAGTTGSGKSEFLQTLVASLAVSNAPEEISFMFIDFKGGAAFRPFESIPHTVGLVTNLDRALVQRALAALRAELDRRQRQLNGAGAEDVTEYLRRRSQSAETAAFPRLVILIDEFAEMKEQMPEFVDGLVAIARTGRSLGVHLVLATQRPHGVVSPEIRANANLRICLRVREDSDSVDVLDHPAAAHIPRSAPGRAYASLGGEVPQLFQSARVGGRAPGRAIARETHAWPAPWEHVGSPRPKPEGIAEESSDLEVLVEAIAAAASIDKRRAPYHPWTAPLPSTIDVAHLPGRPGGPDELDLGLIDLPMEQRVDRWRHTLGEGHLAIVGAARSGRTTALRTFAAQMAESFRVPEAHCWVIDGGQGLRLLSELPHCGTVVPVSDRALVDRLLELLEIECTRRLRTLAADGFASAQEQRSSAPLEDRLPHLVLLVDRWESFVEAFGNTPTADRLSHLLGEGLAAGLTVVLAGDENLLRGRILDRVSHRLVLHLNDPNSASLAGVDPRLMPKGNIPGRGLTENGALVQVALLHPDPSGLAQARALRDLASLVRERHKQDLKDPRAPFRLQPLPDYVRLSVLPPMQECVVAGVCGDDAVPAAIRPLRDGLMVVGPAGSGRSTALRTVCKGLLDKAVRLSLVGAQGSDWRELVAHPGVETIDPDGLSAGDWTALLARSPTRMLVIDDLDKVNSSSLDVALTNARDLMLVAAAEVGSMTYPSPALRAVHKACRTTILLCPPDHHAAASVGMTLERGAGFTGPPGRGFLIDRGVSTRLQVAVAQ